MAGNHVTRGYRVSYDFSTDDVKGGSISKKNRLSDFQTPILGVGNCSCPLPSIAKNHLMTQITLCKISLMSPVTDVIAEMFGRKNM